MSKKTIVIVLALLMPVVGMFVGPVVLVLMFAGTGGTRAQAAQQASAVSCVDTATGAAVIDKNLTPGAWTAPLSIDYRTTNGLGKRPQDYFGGTRYANRTHMGLDMNTKSNVTQQPSTVVAAGPGRVSWFGWMKDGGNSVVIDHGGGIVTRYLHMSSLKTLKIGQYVTAGTPLGMEGNTGGAISPTKPMPKHLHYEVQRNGRALEPEDWHIAVGAPLDGKGSGTTPAPQVGPTPTGDMVKGARPPQGFDLNPIGPQSVPKQQGNGGAPATTAAVSPAPAGSGSSSFVLPAPNGVVEHSGDTPPLGVPANYLSLYQAAAKQYGLPWQFLAAVGMVETQHGSYKASRADGENDSGAAGPMQFTSPTWTDYGLDGNGDGVADRYEPADAIYSAANMLSKTGALNGPEGVRKAIRRYNHADWYVNDVLSYASWYVSKGPVGVPGNGTQAQLTTFRAAVNAAGGSTVNVDAAAIVAANGMCVATTGSSTEVVAGPSGDGAVAGGGGGAVGGKWISPIESPRTTSDFGMRVHPITGKYAMHYGIDLRSKTGSKALLVACPGTGTVTKRDSSRTGGQRIVVTCADGTELWYLHLSQYKASLGQKVNQGDVVGIEGHTGIGSGPHLHFEVRVKGKAVDPRPFMAPRGVVFPPVS